MADSPIVLPKNLPPAPPTAPAAPAGPPGAFWARREGDDLVVQNLAPLPDVCVKCGHEGDVLRRRQNFQWYPKWVLWLLLVNVIVTAVVMQVTMKRGQLALPLCARCKARWSAANLGLGLSVAGLILGIVAALASLANDAPVAGVALLLASIATPTVVGQAVVKPRTVRARRIKDLLLTLTGVHPAAAAAILEASRGKALAPAPPESPSGAIAPPR